MSKRIFKTIDLAGRKIDNPVLLAPMEGITDLPFRIICREMGADIVFSEFIAAEALIRDAKKSFAKMVICDEERPVAVQIFGNNAYAMSEAAKIVEDQGVDILDLNFGCWVRKVVSHESGAALLKDPDRMCEITRAVVDAVKIPVTAKTRIGWNKESIIIGDLAPKMEQTGIKMLSLHCRTRDMGMRGNADWSYIAEAKAGMTIPLILNGDVRTPEDAVRAFKTTPCDGIMIGRAVVGYPFLFREVREALDNEESVKQEPLLKERIDTCIRHLDLSVQHDGFPRGMYEFRKHYSGYLKGLYDSSSVRQKLVVMESLEEIKDTLHSYYDFIIEHEKTKEEQKAVYYASLDKE
jgi:tRNA-dihydrouridine synthase B